MRTAINVLLAPPSGNTILLRGIGDVYGFAHTDLTVSPAQGNFKSSQAMPTSMNFVQNTPTTVLRVSDGTYGGHAAPFDLEGWWPELDRFRRRTG
ncbi:MAG TPA: hypothetical protein VFB43_19410 [Terracidiphilus sp.]|nr:hypothetical protein [Terracidiphilus sp.]